MSKSFEEMDRKELVAAAKLLKLDGNPTTMKTVDLIKELEAEKTRRAIDSGEEVESKPEETETKTAKKKTKMKEATMHDRDADNKRLIKCLVHDTSTTQSVDEQERGMAFSFSWGNLYGQYTETISLDGETQGITKAGIARLREISTVEFYKENGVEKARYRPRFQVTEIGGWTEDEIAALKEKQRLRVAS
jgi:hypothetical protein